MPQAPKILAFAGSAREDSFNKKLLRVAASGAEEAGAQLTLADLQDYPMPIYNQDLEEREGMPQHAQAFKNLLKDHDGLLLSSPEYNGSVTALLKNVLDWASRPAQGEGSLAAFSGKPAALLSASPGGLGGLRGLVHTRSILGNLGMIVIPEQAAVSNAYQAFDDEGKLIDEKQSQKVKAVAQKLAEVTAKLAA